jgi:hypothetical protein
MTAVTGRPRRGLLAAATAATVGCAALAPAAGAPVALAACSYTAKLRAQSHHPKAQKKWAIVVTTSTRLRTSAKYEFYFNGAKVSTQYPFYNHHFKFRRRFRDGTIIWPKRAVGYPLTFRVVVRNRCGTRKMDYAIKVRR